MKVHELAKIAKLTVQQTLAELQKQGFTEITSHLHGVSDEAVKALGVEAPKPEMKSDKSQIHFWSSKADKHKVVVVVDDEATTVRFSDSRLFLDRAGKFAKGLLLNKPRDVFVVSYEPYPTDAECDSFRGFLYTTISPDGEVTSVGMKKVKGLLTNEELSSKTLITTGQQYIDRLVGMIVRTRSIEGMEFK